MAHVPYRSLSKAIGSADTVICTIGAGGSDLSGPKRIDNEVGQSNPVASAMLLRKPWRGGSSHLSLANRKEEASSAGHVCSAIVERSSIARAVGLWDAYHAVRDCIQLWVQWLDGSSTLQLQPCRGHSLSCLAGDPCSTAGCSLST